MWCVCVCDVFVRERRREEKCAMRGLCVRAGAGGAGVCAVFDEEERWDVHSGIRVDSGRDETVWCSSSVRACP